MPEYLGRAVYLTDFKEQKSPLAAVSAASGAPVFISLHISEEFSDDYCDRAVNACNWLNERGFRILADVSEKTTKQFGQNDLVTLARKLHLWALRIDYGFRTEEICSLAAKIPVAVNASTITRADAEKIAASGPVVMAMHNFYPRPETGLDEDFLLERTRMLQNAGLKVLAFIPGDENLRGPVFFGLPTLEAHRCAAPSAAFVDLATRFGMDDIFIGDSGLTSYEEKIIAAFCGEKVIHLPVHLREPYAALYGRMFTCRPDSPKGLVRFQESREYSCFGCKVEPDCCTARDRGVITMDNALYGRYSGEIQLVRSDLPADERVNAIGTVSAKHLLLADCIARGGRFCMIPCCGETRVSESESAAFCGL